VKHPQETFGLCLHELIIFITFELVFLKGVLLDPQPITMEPLKEFFKKSCRVHLSETWLIIHAYGVSQSIQRVQAHITIHIEIGDIYGV